MPLGGMIPLSQALQVTGAVEIIAQGLVRVVGDAGPYPLLIRLVVINGRPGSVDRQHSDGAGGDPDHDLAAAAFGVSGRPLLMAVTVMSAPRS
jgi:hypothetical protein